MYMYIILRCENLYILRILFYQLVRVRYRKTHVITIILLNANRTNSREHSSTIYRRIRCYYHIINYARTCYLYLYITWYKSIKFAFQVRYPILYCYPTIRCVIISYETLMVVGKRELKERSFEKYEK